MANLFFPQLSSGASAQYPIGKTRFIRTIQNVMADGSFYVGQDTGAGWLQWQFSYSDLSFAEITALQVLFDACGGPVQPFTFIDPTDNMLVASADFGNAAWQKPSLITLNAGVGDPAAGTQAFLVTNTSQIAQQLAQALSAPANYQYCFSVFAKSAQPSSISLTRSGLTQGQTVLCNVGPAWARIVSSGQLNDAGTQVTVAIGLVPGQQVWLYGPQLEAQAAPSRYRATSVAGGVYSNAHWAVDALPIVAEAPNLYSVSFTIETVLKG